MDVLFLNSFLLLCISFFFYICSNTRERESHSRSLRVVNNINDDRHIQNYEIIVYFPSSSSIRRNLQQQQQQQHYKQNHMTQ